jgi:hypothetical protein
VFRKLAREEHPVVGEAHLSRMGYVSASCEPGVRDSVMGRAEGAAYGEGSIVEDARHAEKLGRFDGSLEAERRKDT